MIKALEDFCTLIANALRSKKGTTEAIPAANFATEINSLKVGGDISEYFVNEIYAGGLNESLLCKSVKKLPKEMILVGTSCKCLLSNCIYLVEAPKIDTSNAINFEKMLYSCDELVTVPEYNAGKCTNLTSFFGALRTQKIKNFGGLKDLGKAYTQKENNYRYYTLDLSYQKELTHESLMNVINNLYDLNLTYNVAGGNTLYIQQLVLGTNKQKLTSEEIAMVTSKGWTVL